MHVACGAFRVIVRGEAPRLACGLGKLGVVQHRRVWVRAVAVTVEGSIALRLGSAVVRSLGPP
jgi:hypothetical protein